MKPMITYAQNFEDVMLERLFQGQQRGLYLDIGAWDPVKLSVTKHFYDKGWRGINVEPIRSRWRLFQQQRPLDLNLNVAVGRKRGRVRFFECVDRTELSTLSADQASILRSEGHQVRAYDVEMVTLDDLWSLFKGRSVDFVKIDVEGYESEVLMGGSWDCVRPRVLVIEATKPAVPLKSWDDLRAIESWHDWEPLLLRNGYVFAYYDGLSRFYIREEEEALARRLRLPPGVRDNFCLYETVLLRDRVSALEREIAVLKRSMGEGR